MRATFVISTMVAALAVTAHLAHAQRTKATVTIDRGSFAIAPYGGYLVSQNLFEGPLNTKLSVQSAPLYGVQLSLPLAPSASLIGGVAYASGDLQAGLPLLGGLNLGTSNTTLFDASVELRAENFGNGRFIPLVELGGGAIRRSVTVAGLHAKTTDFQVSGAVGADFPISHNLAVRIMAKDHYGKADFGSFAGLDVKTNDLHAVALTGGIRFAF